MSVVREIDYQPDVLTVEPIHDGHDHLRMGTGACTLCSCPSWLPDSADGQCINYNAEGGTCNHKYNEHN